MILLLRWRHFGDVQVDWGQELTVAKVLSEGKLLYIDIAYYRGPLSPSINAFLMHWFGATAQTIMISNSVIAAGIGYGILWLTCRATTLGIGSFAASAFFLVFVCAQQEFINAFNFISPFGHELTHGVFLSLLCVIAAELLLETKRARWSFCSGIALGLAILTRIEIAVALLATSGAWSFVVLKQKKLSRATFIRNAALSGGMALLVVLIAIILLHRVMPWTQATASAFASFVTVWTTSIAKSPFYLFVTGLDNPIAGLSAIMTGCLFASYWFLNIFLGARHFSFGDPWGGWVLTVLGVTPLLLGLRFPVTPLLFGWLLPVTTLCILGYVITVIFRRPTGDAERITAITGVFALLMLGKIILAPHLRFYGFVHAMPAYLLLVTVLVKWVPHSTRQWLSASAHRWFVVLLLAAVLLDIGGKAVLDQRVSNRKVLRLGEGPHRFYVNAAARNIPFAAFLNTAAVLIPPGSSLSAIPEGAMVNFLLDLPLATPFTNYLPTDSIIYGKDRIEKSLFTHPSDFILLTHKDTSEFGYPLFGKMPEYGADVIAWLKRDYEEIARFGEQPLMRKDNEGVALWRRRDFLTVSSQ